MILLRVFIPFAMGYFLSYTFRTVNAVIAPDLVRDLSLGAAELGLLTSAYFLTFAAFQLPLGILLDRFGPRKVEAVLLIFAAIGAVVFATAQSVGVLILGRALIGLGVSACLMAAFKAYVDWFPKERLALAYGLQMTAGGLGALVATSPVEALLQVTDWRGMFWMLSVASLVAALALVTVSPARNAPPGHATLKEALHGLGVVFRDNAFWRLAPLTVASQATFLSVQSLWSGPWLGDVAGFERAVIAHHLFWIAGAMVAGFFGWGIIADRLARRGIQTQTIAIAGMTLFQVVQFFIVFNLVPAQTGAVIVVWMLFGFFGTTGILSYSALTQMFPSALAGRLNTSINLLVFVAAFISQWLIGVVIEQWPAAQGGGYTPEGYSAGFGLMLALQCAGLVWLALAPKPAPKPTQGTSA